MDKEKECKFQKMKSVLASTHVHLTRSMTKVNRNVTFNLPNLSEEKQSTDDEPIITESTKRKSMFDSPDEDDDNDNTTQNFPSEMWNDTSSPNESLEVESPP